MAFIPNNQSTTLSLSQSGEVTYDGGKWVGWTRDHSRIVGVGKTRQDVERAGYRQGLTDIAYEWVQPDHEQYLGTW